MTDGVDLSREGAVLVVRLARPEKRNALTGRMYDALVEALDAAARDPAIGAVVLAGSGGAFTAGNDIANFLERAQGAGVSRAMGFIRALARNETPLVAAVEGVAVGVGATLLLHCDLVYAAPSARFRLPFVDLGLVPEAGSSLLLPARVGLAKASELLLLAEPFDAAEAHRLGLVNAVVPADGLLAHAVERAGALAAKPRGALQATRRLIRGDRDAVLARIDAEVDAFAAALASPEARAAFEAFLARGKPAPGEGGA